MSNASMTNTTAQPERSNMSQEEARNFLMRHSFTYSRANELLTEALERRTATVNAWARRYTIRYALEGFSVEISAPARQVTRLTAYHGMSVEVTWRDGSQSRGTLLAWGASLIRVQTAAGWMERSIVSIDQVNALAG